MSDLKELCSRLHAGLRSGESWLESLKSAVFTHPAFLAEARLKAARFRYIDTSLDEVVFAKAVLAVGWLSLRKPPSEEFCVGEFKTMLDRWARRVACDRKQRKTVDVTDEIPDSACDVISEFENELFRAAVFKWIREFEEPKRTIAQLRIEQELGNKTIANLLGRSEATISEHWKSICITLAQKIRNWQEEG